MPGLFAGATVFVYPSLYEGFGFPVVQAMASGTPVITSGLSALPEITGGAALLIDPRSKIELGDAVMKLLSSSSMRADLAGRGRVRAQHFKWDNCVRESIQFFEEVASRRL